MRHDLLLAVLGLICLSAVEPSRAEDGHSKSESKQPAGRSNALLERIEQKANRTLSAQERAEVSDAIQDLVKGMTPPREQFVRDISRISGVPEKRVWEMMPKIGGPADQDKNMMPKLQEAMGRRLTPDELDAVRTADERKKSAIQKKRETFVGVVSTATGVPTTELMAMLPRVGV